MYEFRPGGGGVLRLDVDFSDDDYANISFYDAARADIVLHLSLRARERIAVFNRRVDGNWENERSVQLPAPRGIGRVEFAFDVPRVRATIDGKTLFGLGEEDCPGLDRIGWYELHGGFVAESVAFDWEGARDGQGWGALVYVAPFDVEGWGLDRARAEQDAVLSIAGIDEPPVVAMQERPELAGRTGVGRPPVGVRLTLPARAWATAEGALELTLAVNGRPCGRPLRITRGEMVANIELALGRAGIDGDARMALLCLEHVAGGGFWDKLSAGAQAALLRIATLYRVETLLPEGVEPPRPEPTPVPLDVKLAEEAFLAMVADHRGDAGGEATALIARIPALPPGARRALCLMLTELFCAEGAFGALHAHAVAEGLSEMGEGGDAWQRSLRLPWLVAGGEAERAEALMRRIAGEADARVSTAAIGWAVRQAVEDAAPGLGSGLAIGWRERMVERFLDFLDAQAAGYWGCATGRHMVEAVMALLAARARFRPDLARRVVATALKAQGLSPRFWQAHDAALAAGRLAAEPVLEAARGGFAAIAATRGEEIAAEEAAAGLAIFARAGNADAARFRRELLGPLGQAGPAEDGAALARALMAEGEELGPALLRATAFPAEPPLVGEAAAAELAPALRRVVSASYDMVGHSPHHELQADLSRRIAELVAVPGAASAPALDRLFADLAALTSEADLGLGLALGVVLFDALLRAGREGEARAAMARVESLRAALPDRVAASHAVQMAVAAALSRAGGHPLAGWLGECLPQRDAGPAALPEGADEGVETPALYDLMVIVISCRPYLDSRIPAMRAAWLDRLEALGVPWVVAVGGGEGAPRREGHVLHLNAPDDYEGLPQKVLAAFDWALGHTRAGHVLKIDDDCLVDVEAFLQAQSWRKHAYYGRKLAPVAGQTDRKWHQAKATSERARGEVDKSPEPASYCDGATGYVLSRVALAALGARRRTGPGQLLALSSFLEDKLVGDLLAGAGIEPGDEDYLFALKRRSRGGGAPVSVWPGGFLPSAASGVKLAHLDSVEGLAEAAALKDRAVLWPKKVWPSYAAPTLRFDDTVLDLVSPVARLQAVNAAGLAVVAVVRNDMFMLPHFLAHYRAMGVESFLIADNLSDDGTLDYLLAQPDVATFSVDCDYRASREGAAWQQALLSNFRVNRWSLVADVDALLVTGPDGPEPLAAVLAGAAFEGADAARIFGLDLYPKGPLSEVRFDAAGPFAEAGWCDREPFLANWPGQGPFGDQPGWSSALRHRLIPAARPWQFLAQKLALLKYRPWMRLSAGLHFIDNVRLARRELVFAQFKFHAGLAAKLRDGVTRKPHLDGAEPWRHALARLGEGHGEIHDPEVSVDWRESPAVRAILG